MKGDDEKLDDPCCCDDRQVGKREKKMEMGLADMVGYIQRQ